MTGPTAAECWRDQLARWAIPEEILAAAPTNPHTFSVRRFTDLAAEARRQPLTTTHRRAAERLPDGGTVLDVGCGGGAGSLPLADQAGLLVGADESDDMLAAFTDAARRLGVAVETVAGAWPDAASRAPVADVVVCLHVVYNISALAPFVQQLTGHARRRVVLELPTRHPLDWLRPYWKQVHGIDRPDGPTDVDALQIVRETGQRPEQQQWRRSNSLARADRDEQIEFICQRLAVGQERRGEIAALVDRHGVPTERAVVTAWWDVDGA